MTILRNQPRKLLRNEVATWREPYRLGWQNMVDINIERRGMDRPSAERAAYDYIVNTIRPKDLLDPVLVRSARQAEFADSPPTIPFRRSINGRGS